MFASNDRYVAVLFAEAIFLRLSDAIVPYMWYDEHKLAFWGCQSVDKDFPRAGDDHTQGHQICTEMNEMCR